MTAVELEPLLDVLRRWLPDAARAAGALADPELPSFAAEMALVANAVGTRRAEFAAGRRAAHHCLEQLAVARQPILAGERGAPCWPDGVFGSITHESGIALAAAVAGADAAPIGIDLFDTRRIVDISSLTPLFLGAQERRRARDDRQRMILFSAKESVIKALSARVGRYLEFTEIEVTNFDAGFEAVLAGSGLRARGRWALVGPFVLTLALL